jgi:hypothetical protein
VAVDTGSVVTTKVAVLAPAATVTVAGTVAALLVVVNDTTSAAAVTPFKVIVPVDVFPPIKVLGLKVTELRAGGFTVKVADVLDTPLYDPETVPVVAALTGVVVTVKVAVFCPARTVTVAGVAAAAFVVVIATTAPPVGAVPFKVTVAVEDTPPKTVAGLMLNDRSAAGVTVRFAFRVMPEYEAEMAVVELDATPEVEIEKVALVAPAATVTLAGTVATAGSAMDSATTVPPTGAAFVNVTVPVTLAPLTTVVGLRLNVDRFTTGGAVTVNVAVCWP